MRPLADSRLLTKTRVGQKSVVKNCIREIAALKAASRLVLAGSTTAGGLGVRIKGNTDLKGAVIASDADASKNNLSTGTLTFGDIQNQSSYDAHSGGFSTGVTTGDGGANYSTHGPGSTANGPNAGGGAPMLSQNDSGSDSATTRSGISAGAISVTDAANQTQDIASLNQDTSNTNGTVAKLPDVNNLLDRQADMMAAASAAGEAVSRRIGDYADAQAKATGDPAWAEGGAYRAEMQAAGAALVTGLAGGNALGGDAGAFEGYNVDRFNRQLHPVGESNKRQWCGYERARQDKCNFWTSDFQGEKMKVRFIDNGNLVSRLRLTLIVIGIGLAAVALACELPIFWARAFLLVGFFSVLVGGMTSRAKLLISSPSITATRERAIATSRKTTGAAK